MIGARQVGQLDDNLDCLSVELGNEHLDRLDEASRISFGFPHDFITANFMHDMIHGRNFRRIDAGDRAVAKRHERG